jgi:hypothetical protein
MRYAAVRIAVFRYTPAAVLVDNVDTLPEVFDEKRAGAEGCLYIFAEVVEGRLGRGYASELGVFAMATMSVCASPGALSVKVLHRYKRVTVLARGGLKLRRYLEPVGVELRPREVYKPASFLDTCSN